MFSAIGCSVRTMALREMGEIVAGGVPAFERDDDVELLKQALPANIKLLEAMLESDPDNTRLLVMLSQMYASYTFAMLEPELENPKVANKAEIKERINRLYGRGIAFGERAVRLVDPSCIRGVQSIAELDPCLAAASKDDVAAMFWYGFNLGAHLNRNLDSMAALAQAPKIEKLMNRIIALDEGFNYGNAHLFLMTLYGARSKMLGGDIAKADQHYEAMKRLNGGDFLLADVFYARYVDVQKDDRPEFERRLKAVIASQPNSERAGRVKLYNALAKARAKVYLAGADDFF